MKKPAIIWRESVYKNGFKCSCGTKLFDGVSLINVHNSPMYGEKGYIFCDECNTPVAKTTFVDLPEDAEGMMGNYEEFKRGKMS